jgi:tRNA dimethylallyltransferase
MRGVYPNVHEHIETDGFCINRPKVELQIIMGPTASGKSALALEWAQKLDGYIVNADSMQVYRNFPILSAQPSTADLQQAPHHLYSIRDVTGPCSAAEWVRLVKDIIDTQSGVPIIVGGTGFYLQALIHGLSPIPDIPKDIRSHVRALPDPHTILQQQDPVMAAKLNPGDTQRSARALEVILSTGRSLVHWQEKPLEKVIDMPMKITTVLPPRNELYERINLRVLKMIEAGAIEEVEAVFKRHLDPALPGMKTIGYPEIAAYLEGQHTLDETIPLIQTASRQYAKRQMTWLRHRVVEDAVIG